MTTTEKLVTHPWYTKRSRVCSHCDDQFIIVQLVEALLHWWVRLVGEIRLEVWQGWHSGFDLDLFPLEVWESVLCPIQPSAPFLRVSPNCAASKKLTYRIRPSLSILDPFNPSDRLGGTSKLQRSYCGTGKKWGKREMRAGRDDCHCPSAESVGWYTPSYKLLSACLATLYPAHPLPRMTSLSFPSRLLVANPFTAYERSSHDRQVVLLAAMNMLTAVVER